MSKVIDLIKLVARCLGFDMMIDDINSGATLPITDQKNKQDIITAINHTLADTAVGDLPFIAKKTVTVSGGKFNLSRLSERIYRVESLTQNGLEVTFDVKGENIYAYDGTYELEYRYVPVVAEEDDLPFASYPIEKLIAYGASMQFCLMNGRISEAWNWHKAYEIELDWLYKSNPPKSGRLKARAWA